jgi:hypothetical protein
MASSGKDWREKENKFREEPKVLYKKISRQTDKTPHHALLYSPFLGREHLTICRF